MTRGGKRQGAGRPKNSGRFPGESKTMRVPVAQIDAVKKFLSSRAHTLKFSDEVRQTGRLVGLKHAATREFRFIGDVVHEAQDCFVVIADDESMLDVGIRPDDVLIVDRTRTANEGDIVVVTAHEEFTVKHYHRTRTGHILLRPGSKMFKPVLVSPEELHVWGVVTYMIHKFN